MAPIRCPFTSCKWTVLNGTTARKLRHLGNCSSCGFILLTILLKSTNVLQFCFLTTNSYPTLESFADFVFGRNFSWNHFVAGKEKKYFCHWYFVILVHLYIIHIWNLCQYFAYTIRNRNNFQNCSINGKATSNACTSSVHMLDQALILFVHTFAILMQGN